MSRKTFEICAAIVEKEMAKVREQRQKFERMNSGKHFPHPFTRDEHAGLPVTLPAGHWYDIYYEAHEHLNTPFKEIRSHIKDAGESQLESFIANSFPEETGDAETIACRMMVKFGRRIGELEENEKKLEQENKAKVSKSG